MSFKDIDWRAKIRPIYRFGKRVPAGLRSLLGVLLIGAGVIGIVMPLLGFWMAPLGLLFIALDVPALRRRTDAWLEPEGSAESGSS